MDKRIALLADMLGLVEDCGTYLKDAVNGNSVFIKGFIYSPGEAKLNQMHPILK